jgi:hypothetical protein
LISRNALSSINTTKVKEDKDEKDLKKRFLLSQFGLDFWNNGWGETLCKMDSDGDGISNGEELGDPDCIWRFDGFGSVPTPPANSNITAYVTGIKNVPCAAENIPSDPNNKDEAWKCGDSSAERGPLTDANKSALWADDHFLYLKIHMLLMGISWLGLVPMAVICIVCSKRCTEWKWLERWLAKRNEGGGKTAPSASKESTESNAAANAVAPVPVSVGVDVEKEGEHNAEVPSSSGDNNADNNANKPKVVISTWPDILDICELLKTTHEYLNYTAITLTWIAVALVLVGLKGGLDGGLHMILGMIVAVGATAVQMMTGYLQNGFDLGDWCRQLHKWGGYLLVE